MVMGITSVSVMLAVLVSNISHNGRYELPLPKLFHTCTIFLSRFMCYRLSYIQARENSRISARSNTLSQSRRNLYQSNNCAHVSSDSGYGLLDYEIHHGHGRPENNQGHGRPENNQGNSFSDVYSSLQKSLRGHAREDEVETMLKMLQRVLKDGVRDAGQDTRLQWDEAARVLDRFLFYIFLLLTVAATIITLVIIPLTKPEVPSLVPYT